MTANIDMPDNSSTHKILYVHIPKTAGLAFQVMMADEFGAERVFKLGLQNDKSSKSIQDLMNMSDAEQDRFSMFAGHLPHGIRDYLNSVTLQLTCFRDPIFRILSLRRYNESIGHSLPDYDTWLKEEFEASNGMVKRFLGLHVENGRYFDFRNKKTFEPDIQLTSSHLEEAINIIESNYPLVMLVEQFSESLVLLQRRIQSKPLFSIWHNYRNQTAKATDINNVPTEVIEKIKSANELDIALYHHFRKKLQQTIKNQDASFFEEVRLHKKIVEILKYKGTQNLSIEEFQRRLNILVANAMAGKDVKDIAKIFNMFSEKLTTDKGFQEFNKKFQAQYA